MLSVMRDPRADDKRRDAMAMAAAPYLHPKLSSLDAKLSSASDKFGDVDRIEVTFVHPAAPGY
jgi:predicted RNase H-like nuclease (RuvC/YqgF family)